MDVLKPIFTFAAAYLEMLFPRQEQEDTADASTPSQTSAGNDSDVLCCGVEIDDVPSTWNEARMTYGLDGPHLW